jgi:hypothetical protein
MLFIISDRDCEGPSVAFIFTLPTEVDELSDLNS